MGNQFLGVEIKFLCCSEITFLQYRIIVGDGYYFKWMAVYLPRYERTKYVFDDLLKGRFHPLPKGIEWGKFHSCINHADVMD